MKNDCVIYALTDPETGLVRYIGSSTRGLKRAEEHWFCLSSSGKNQSTVKWVRSLRACGTKYGVRLLETVLDRFKLLAAEKRWIQFGIEQNWPLLNVHRRHRAPFVPVDMMAPTPLTSRRRPDRYSRDRVSDGRTRILAVQRKKGLVYECYVRIKGENRYLGCFESEKIASQAAERFTQSFLYQKMTAAQY